MAGFRKAKAEQAALKLGMYGASGSGKTFTALLIAEGLAKVMGKRIALVDTEHGSDFYCKTVLERKAHPEAFDFDALYTKSITEILDELRKLGPDYGIVIVDSITHIWEAARNAYSGKVTVAGTIPFHAWGKIKKPYKDLINILLSSPLHVIICGRQGNEFEEDEETGELKRVGWKMKAEGETPYEPHVLLRLEAVRDPKSRVATITAFAEKDRTGLLSGQTISWPCFENIAKPMLALFGATQAQMPTDDEVGQRDAEKLAEEDKAKAMESQRILKELRAKISLCEDQKALEKIGKEITPELKKRMTTGDVAELREFYLEGQRNLPGGK